MESIEKRLAHIKDEIRTAALACGRDPETIDLVAVSKKKSSAAVTSAIQAGVTLLGENYIQEAMDKINTIGNTPASWHFIGHLQSNKAKFAVPYFDLIHTVDSFKLAREINKQAAKINKRQAILMQVNIADEATKSGTTAASALALAREIAPLEHIHLTGLMGMPPFFDDPEGARPYFKAMANLFNTIQKEEIPGVDLEHLSMGMSGDFKVAIEEGSTLVRIGTAIFGSRE
ncbi:hypothetical protein SAMN02746065_103100 [Desulfocicer vacuolatum DSM 3385]|uniref:Pyridoxal phosphate homeostasis protein n=1 Tax=Desulfocicer vacuolatum DSM 3385 TaxID=1121400 RepID=A0A1W1ZQX8_9BACT|nr:YggS family pyridoxal phosphate-dependent enzyme [Desulfocicer vacuolatum]SMC50683.1 hypothetical protein SAMN02746065_103100 [Desulfocicer vacuolatum DSM 3385]